MSEEIDAQLIKGITSHQDIAEMLTWLDNLETQDWQSEHVKSIEYSSGSDRENRYMAETLFGTASSARFTYIMALLEQVENEIEKEAGRSKENEEAHANYTPGTAFHRAAKDGDTDKVKKLLDNPEIDGNEADENGKTPLDHAAKYGHSAVVKLLLDNPEIDCNNVDASGNTPLHYAIKHGHSAVVEPLFADDKINVKMQDFQGNTH